MREHIDGMKARYVDAVRTARYTESIKDKLPDFYKRDIEKIMKQVASTQFCVEQLQKPSPPLEFLQAVVPSVVTLDAMIARTKREVLVQKTKRDDALRALEECQKQCMERFQGWV